jgi:lysophospholipase L1-like esterase
VVVHVPLYRQRESRKAEFLLDLYTIRVLGLGISPTTRRHILGQPLAQNFAAMTDLLRLARASGALVLVYNAPVNPAVSMFYEDEYRAYVERLRALAAAESAVFADLATAVPRDLWGYWIDGPDPIHVSEGGHGVIATRLDEAFGPRLAER